MMLIILAGTSDAIAAIRSRSAKVRALAEILVALAPDEREIGVAWLAGSLPQGRLGLGPATVYDMRGVEPAQTPTLTIAAAHTRLSELAAITGKGSAPRRRAALAELFELATAVEQSFLARLLLGELRQGALAGVMTDAIAAAASLPIADVRRAIMLAGDIASVAAAALSDGVAGLERFRLTLGRFVSPMLASPTESVASALAAWPRAIFDYKLDGARVQIHKHGGDVAIYSRSGNDVTGSLPETRAAIVGLAEERLILDGEVIALEPSGRPRPFQQTMSRFGRKLVGRDAHELSLFCFDCLHAGGADLIDEPAERRAGALAGAVGSALVVPRLVTGELAAAEHFFAAALAAGHEGLMAKSPDARYEAGSRGASWLKIKVAHTLDLVVLGAEWGSGRRRGWLSNLHLGARDGRGGFVMLGKTFKGLTDETLAWQTEQLAALAIDGVQGHVVRVRPELVVEIAFNELQVSRRYPGGLALRFARVVRYRPDKTPADVDSMDTVRALVRP